MKAGLGRAILRSKEERQMVTVQCKDPAASLEDLRAEFQFDPVTWNSVVGDIRVRGTGWHLMLVRDRA